MIGVLVKKRILGAVAFVFIAGVAVVVGAGATPHHDPRH
jgi:hypothetical protein